VTERITTVSVSIKSLPNFTPRSIGPSVTPALDGQHATLTFAGFHTANASDDLSDYRQIGRVTLELVPSD